MDLGTAIVLLGLAAAPVAVLGGWLAGRDRMVATPLGTTSESWWRDAMPWPHGVQEDDDVHWNFGADDAVQPRSTDDVGGSAPTVRLRPTIRRSRPH